MWRLRRAGCHSRSSANKVQGALPQPKYTNKTKACLMVSRYHRHFCVLHQRHINTEPEKPHSRCFACNRRHAVALRSIGSIKRQVPGVAAEDTPSHRQLKSPHRPKNRNSKLGPAIPQDHVSPRRCNRNRKSLWELCGQERSDSIRQARAG